MPRLPISFIKIWIVPFKHTSIFAQFGNLFCFVDVSQKWCNIKVIWKWRQKCQYLSCVIGWLTVYCTKNCQWESSCGSKNKDVWNDNGVNSIIFSLSMVPRYGKAACLHSYSQLLPQNHCSKKQHPSISQTPFKFSVLILYSLAPLKASERARSHAREFTS